jgi:cell division protein FtsQ
LRSVNTETARRPRDTSDPGRNGRGGARSGGTRDDPPPGVIRRMARAVESLFTFRHPVFFFSFLLSLFVFVFGLLASGVIGRAVRHTERVVDAFAVRAGFAVASVNVAGAVRLPRNAILTEAGIGPGQSVFSVRPHEARARLMQDAWIKDAAVRRRFPGEIEVKVTERVPFALWQETDGARVFVVERTGARITDRGAEAFKSLPLLVGEGAPAAAGNFVDAVRRHSKIASVVRVYQYRGQRRWDLILANGVTVKLPESEWRRQLDDLERLIAREGVLDYDTGEIDLRSNSYYYFGQVPATKTEIRKPEEGRPI